MSIESHLVNLRTYLEDLSSRQSQILSELKRLTNQVNQANSYRGTLETEPPPDAFLAAVTQSVDLSKTKPTGSVTLETVEVKTAPKPAAKTTATKSTSKKASK